MRVATMGDQIDVEPPEVLAGPRCASVSGVNVHANVSVAARDRMGLERLCRYAGRPPVAIERLSLLPDGRLLYRLKRRWRNGTTHVIFEPLELIEKLAALVPRPRFNLVQVSWCTCSAAEWGPYVVPSAALPDSLGHPAVSQKRRGQLISSLKWDVLPGNILHPALGIIRGLSFCTAFSRSMSWSAPSVPDA